jgi:hypothetical protein
MSDWKPSEEDIRWTKNLFRMLAVGGHWGTSFAIYRRSGENEITLESVIRGGAMRDEDVDENLERTEIAIKRCGYKYVVADSGSG